MFEHRRKALAPRREYLRHQLNHTFVAVLIIVGALTIGVAGYRIFEHQRWVDAFYSASMILTGMGPAGELTSDAGKLFASFYALFSGIIFLSTSAVILAPALHRFMHRIHLDAQQQDAPE